MNKLIGIINSLEYKELKAIQKDLAEGNMGRLIKGRIDEIEKEKEGEERVCPTCGSKISEESAKYILTFGSSDFRKRAMFDEIDCLSFFIEKLKRQNNEVVH